MLPEPESRATLVGGRDVQLSEEHTFLSLCFSSSKALHPSCSACGDLKLAAPDQTDTSQEEEMRTWPEVAASHCPEHKDDSRQPYQWLHGGVMPMTTLKICNAPILNPS